MTTGERAGARWVRVLCFLMAVALVGGSGTGAVAAGATEGRPPGDGGPGGDGSGEEVHYLATGARTGDVYPVGAVPFRGSLADTADERDVAAIAATTSGHGYWLATADGGVHAYGDARHLGDIAHLDLVQPIVGMAATPDGSGYWLVAADGGLFTFGSARFHGSMGGVQLASPVVGIASAPDGRGYWMAAADGGVFTFGSARWFGSMGGTALAAPVTTMIATASGDGYWLFAADGGVFTFGRASFLGSLGGQGLDQQIVAGVPTADGSGYWLAGEHGAVWVFGTAAYHGRVATAGDEPVIGIAAPPDGSGYWLATTNRPRLPVYSGVPLPGGSGEGRRVVYSNSMQRVWLVDDHDRVVDSYLVSGRYATPAPGHYAVFSKSRHAWAGHDGITMEYMVRFARGRSLAIGFHAIPVYGNGRPMQTEAELGQFRSSGCVRQRVDKARQLYEWAPVGTPVVVLG